MEVREDDNRHNRSALCCHFCYIVLAKRMGILIFLELIENGNTYFLRTNHSRLYVEATHNTTSISVRPSSSRFGTINTKSRRWNQLTDMITYCIVKDGYLCTLSKKYMKTFDCQYVIPICH